jgi:hypothetical protein
MIINFRQGIVTYPTSSNQQVFLSKVGSYVNLQTANGKTDVAFAYGSKDYLITESVDVPNAWGPLLPNTDYWLYWNIDLTTAVRTFGVALLAPITSPIQPAGVVGQHWFNVADNKMYVYQSGRWNEVLRVFAALVNNGIFTTLGQGYPSKPFSGTQVGLTTTNVSIGSVVVDNVNLPIRKSDGSFFTSEDLFFTNGAAVNTLRPDSSVLHATATQTVAKYQIVKFTKFGKIALAAYNDLQSTLTAITLEDIPVNNTGSLCIQGVVTNPLWNWTSVGAQLWVDDSGELIDVDPHISNPLTHIQEKVALARVISPTSIYFTQGLGAKGDTGLATTLDSLSDVEVPASIVGDLLRWDGTNWVNYTLPYDLGFYIPFTPFELNTIVSGFLSARVVLLSSTSPNTARCSTAPTTVETVFNLKLNGSTIITVTFGVGQTVGTILFTPSSTVTVAPGATITIETTGDVDNSIAGIGVTLVGVTLS